MFQIFLQDNSFDGSIPASFGSLSELVSLDVSNNNLSGALPTELGNLSSILLFGISNNDFSGALPDWSGISAPENANFELVNNYFDFSDLEPLINNGVTYNNLSYSPQRTLDTEEEIMSPPGVDIELNVNDANIDRNSNDVSSNNQYQWFKDDVEIPGADASIYTIVNAQISDSGVYYCEITNPLLPDLTIIRANITVTVDENLGVDDFDYNDFKMYPNPAKDWITIKTKPLNNGKMQIFNMTGQLILEKPLTTEITSLTVDQLTSGVYFYKHDLN